MRDSCGSKVSRLFVYSATEANSLSPLVQSVFSGQLPCPDNGLATAVSASLSLSPLNPPG